MVKTLIGIAVLAASAAACASEPYAYDEPRYAPAAYYGQPVADHGDVGRVVAIDVVRDSHRASGGGALLGGIAGGVLGHQIGSGRGNTAATIAGAVGGAAVGNEVEKRHGGNDYYRVTVRFRDGREETYDRDDVGDLHVGDRVHVDGGRLYRD
jgi:outer membrane lipoprotein SlyB